MLTPLQLGNSSPLPLASSDQTRVQEFRLFDKFLSCKKRYFGYIRGFLREKETLRPQCVCRLWRQSFSPIDSACQEGLEVIRQSHGRFPNLLRGLLIFEEHMMQLDPKESVFVTMRVPVPEQLMLTLADFPAPLFLNVTHLHINSFVLLDENLTLMQLHFPNLKKLGFGISPASPLNLSTFEKLNEFESLETIEVFFEWGNALTLLKNVRSISLLRVDIGEGLLTSEGFSQLKGFSSLTSLEISYLGPASYIRRPPCDSLQHLSSLTSLKRLLLYNIAYVDMDFLGKNYFPKAHITTLILQNCDLRCAAITTLGSCPSLTELQLYSISFTYAFTPLTLKAISSCTHLKALTLDSMADVNSADDFVMQLSKCTGLKEFTFIERRVSGVIEEGFGVGKNRKLNPQAIKTLALSLHKLRSISLGPTFIKK